MRSPIDQALCAPWRSMRASRPGSEPGRAALIALLTLLLSGCLRAASSPALPPPVRLAAPERFTLYERNVTSNTLEPHCSVRRLDGVVLSIRGDSLLLGNVRVSESPSGATACTRTDSLYVLASRDTQVRSEATFLLASRALTAAVLLVPAAVYAAFRLYRALGLGEDGYDL